MLRRSIRGCPGRARGGTGPSLVGGVAVGVRRDPGPHQWLSLVPSSTARRAGSSTNATNEAVATLIAHRGQLNRLAHALFEAETLNEDEAYAAAGVSKESGGGAEHEPSRSAAVVAVAASAGDGPTS
jgi:hypothetical protein